MKREFTREQWKELVRRALVNLKCTQVELAERLGCGYYSVNNWLNKGIIPYKRALIEDVKKHANAGNTGLVPEEGEKESSGPVNRLDTAGQIVEELVRIRRILSTIADRITVADEINSRIHMLELEADRREKMAGSKSDS